MECGIVYVVGLKRTSTESSLSRRGDRLVGSEQDLFIKDVKRGMCFLVCLPLCEEVLACLCLMVHKITVAAYHGDRFASGDFHHEPVLCIWDAYHLVWPAPSMDVPSRWAFLLLGFFTCAEQSLRTDDHDPRAIDAMIQFKHVFDSRVLGAVWSGGTFDKEIRHMTLADSRPSPRSDGPIIPDVD